MTTADQENRANLLSVTPLVWRVESLPSYSSDRIGRVMFDGKALTPDEFTTELYRLHEGEINAWEGSNDPCRVGSYRATWDGSRHVTVYRGTPETTGTLHGCTYTECSDYNCPITAEHCQCGTTRDNHPDADGEGNLHRGRPE